MMREKYQKERANLGLPPVGPRFESFDDIWNRDEELRVEVQKEQEKQWQELREKDERFRQHVKSRWETKDGREYQVPEMVPAFDEAAFSLLVPEPEAVVQETAAQS